MLSLLRVATGDNWAELLEDLLDGVPGCDTSSDCTQGCCANPWLTSPFFVSFVVIAQFVLLNVVVVGFWNRVAGCSSGMSLRTRKRTKHS